MLAAGSAEGSTGASLSDGASEPGGGAVVGGCAAGAGARSVSAGVERSGSTPGTAEMSMVYVPPARAPGASTASSSSQLPSPEGAPTHTTGTGPEGPRSRTDLGATPAGAPGAPPASG